MLREAQALKSLAKDLKQSDRGLAVDRHHAHAGSLRATARNPRFPPEISRRAVAPAPGHLDQIAEMATLDRIDFAINTGSQDKFPDFVLLPIYSWHRQIIVPKDHPLAQIAKPTLQQLPNIRWSPTCSASPARRRCSSSSRAPASNPTCR
jgi:LysR family cys regulon transcriptional activator